MLQNVLDAAKAALKEKFIVLIHVLGEKEIKLNVVVSTHIRKSRKRNYSRN